jgi:hypothetical protein
LFSLGEGEEGKTGELVDILSSSFVWIYGPHCGSKHDLTIFRENLQCGSKHDLTIFRENLQYKLEEGEMAEADQGYEGEEDFIRARDDYCTKAEKKEKGKIRNRHEACNRRFKCWGILKQEYHHDIQKHGYVVLAIGFMTQMAIDNGSCLFVCEPKMNQKKYGAYSIDDFDLTC